MVLRFRRAEEIKSVTAEVVPVEDRSKEVEALQKKVDNLNRLLEGKVNEVVDVQKQLYVSCFYNGPATSVVNLNSKCNEFGFESRISAKFGSRSGSIVIVSFLREKK